VVSNTNLIPGEIKRWYQRKDSIRLARIALEEAAERAERAEEQSNKPNTEALLENNSKPIGGDDTSRKNIQKPSLLLNEDKRKKVNSSKP
jgi:penicillin-binding protein 2